MKLKKTFFLTAMLGFFTWGSAHANNDLTFDQWLSEFKEKARTAHIHNPHIKDAIDPKVIEETLAGLSVNQKVVKYDQTQSETQKPTETLTKLQIWNNYRDKKLTAWRIGKGVEMMQKHRDLLKAVSDKYGVAPQYIVALWGVETNFGTYTGNFDIVRSLSTLAHEGRRRGFFEQELLYTLEMIDRGYTDKQSMKGSWAGAMGQCQFMPSSYLEYAKDFDGDGKRDIWNNLGDVFASVSGHLLADKDGNGGWKEGERWGRQVVLPNDFDQSLISWTVLQKDDEGNYLRIEKSLDEWQKLGVRLLGGANLPQSPDMKGTLIAPGGNDGPIYMVYHNYLQLVHWNKSFRFATSVGLLADRLALAR